MHTLADSLPPDVLNGAGALAVDTLDLVSANDGVLQGTAVLNREDGVRVATLAFRAANAAAESLHATIVGLVAGDDVRLVKGLAALGRREGEGVGAPVELGEARGETRGGRGQHAGRQGQSQNLLDKHIVQ